MKNNYCMKINFQFVILLFILLFIVFIVGCVEKREIKSEQKKIEKLGQCKGISDMTTKDNCYFKKATEQFELTTCLNIQNIGLKYSCFNEVTKNPLVCENAGELLQKNDCYKFIAEGKHDISLCEKVSEEERDFCYGAYLELSKEDISEDICEKIDSTFLKDDCFTKIAEEKQDAYACERISKENVDTKNYCFAVAGVDSKFCEKIQESTKNSCFLWIARKKKDSSICMKVDSLYLNTCYNSVAVAAMDPLICESLNPDPRNGCYFNVATAKQDSAVCDKISAVQGDLGYVSQEFAEDMKNNCYAHSMKDSSYCEKFENIESKNYCYYKIATENSNPLICDKITDSKDSCYYFIAKKETDFSICEKIENVKTKNSCYVRVGIFKQK